jgi:predicted small lipoprotein YifL
MKRAILATLVALSLAACGDSGSPAKKDADNGASTTVEMKDAPKPGEEGRTPSPAGAKVFITEPKDGATVKSPVTVKFGVKGMVLAPAGSDTPDSGHHHLLIDAKPDNSGAPAPADATHIHYGKAQTEGQVELAPGKHTLQDVFADKNHIPFVPPVESEVVTITVE